MTGLFRLAFSASRDGAERASSALEAGVPAPVTSAFFAEGSEWCVEVLYDCEPDGNDIARVLRKALGAPPHFDLAPLPERDWVAQSLIGLKPVRAGRFLIHGHHDRQHASTAPVAIEIEAGAAFGTGHHATTHGCLIALDRILRAEPRPRILDIGTGTGVLAIAAAKSTKARVMASDIDPIAVRVTRANVRANGAGPLVDVVCAATPLHREIVRRAPYDIVLANILAEPLTRLAAPVARISSQRSKIVLSGLLDHQVSMVQPAWRAQGFALANRLSIDGWTTLILARGRTVG